MAQALTWKAKSLESHKSAGVPGVLTVRSTGFKWVPNNPNSGAVVSADYGSIKSHRSSKEGTTKKALLNLSTDSPKVQYLFEFESFSERDACRNYLGKYIPTNATTQPASNHTTAPATTTGENLNHAEMQRRMKELQEDSELQKLHQHLVMTGDITEAEFWASRKRPGQFQKQKTGLQSAMLADIRPLADGRSNKVTFSLTPEVIHQIFAEKPAVHRAFLKNVPAKMSEVEFWTKYCRAEYLFKTKNAAAATAEAADDEDLAVFVNDDDIITNESRRKIKKVDPTLDMASDDADDYLSLPGHGLYRDGTKEPLESTRTQAKNKLMRDLNRHGEVVLEGRLLAEGMNDTMTIAHALAKTQQQDARTDLVDVQERVERVHSMTELEDLQGPRGPAPAPLSIQDPRKYFDVQTSAGTGTSSSTLLDPKEVMQRLRIQVDECRSKNVAGTIIPSALALKVLSDLTQAISSTQHPLGKTAEKNVLDILPPTVRNALLQHSSTINELLKHFWATHPITSKTLAQKANRLKDKMSKIYNEIQELKGSVQSEHRHQVSLILQPMFQTLDAALAATQGSLNL